jgi:hypothetical protein
MEEPTEVLTLDKGIGFCHNNFLLLLNIFLRKGSSSSKSIEEWKLHQIVSITELSRKVSTWGPALFNPVCSKGDSRWFGI